MAAHIRDMTAILPRTHKGQPTGGEFASQNRPEATVALGIQTGDTVRPISAEKSRALIENSLVEIDRAWLAEAEADTNIEDGAAAGTAHAHAEVIAYVTSDNLRDYNYEAQGERILNDRREGYFIEQEKNFTGPGELTAIKRQLVVNHCRKRADELFEKATEEPIEDAAAHLFARSEAFAEAALDVSASNAFYTPADD